MTYLEFINSSDLDIMLNDKDMLANILIEPYDTVVSEQVTTNSIFTRIMADPAVGKDIKQKVFNKMDYYFGTFEGADSHYRNSITNYKNICWRFAMHLVLPGTFSKESFLAFEIAGINPANIDDSIPEMFKNRLIYFQKYDEEQRKNRELRKSNEDDYTKKRQQIVHFYKRYLLVPEKVQTWESEGRNITTIMNSCFMFEHEIIWHNEALDRTYPEANEKAKDFIKMSEELLLNTERYITDYDLEKIFRNYQAKNTIVNPLKNDKLNKMFEKLKKRVK